MKPQKLSVYLMALFGIAMILFFSAFTSEKGHTETYVRQTPWENLKVLPQNISKDSLTNLMKTYAISLGVKCNHCHVPSKTDPSELDFASDAKIEKKKLPEV